MRRLNWILIAMLIAVAIFTIPTKIAIAQTTTTPTWSEFIWPLCGRIKEEPGNAWKNGDDCDYVTRIEQQHKTDFPIYHGFGYRTFNDVNSPTSFYIGVNSPISFHRGIDLATAGNSHNSAADNPVFAAASGFVKSVTCDKEGQSDADPNDPSKPCLSDRDYQVVLLHPANGASQCSTKNPCQISVYNHVRNVLVKNRDSVVKGKQIAWTGTGHKDNFDHLHFAIRDPYKRASVAKMMTPVEASFAKDARNPMFYLPYPPLSGTEPFRIEITETSLVPNVDVWVTLNANSGYNLNLKYIKLEPSYKDSNGEHQRAFDDAATHLGTYVKEYVVNNSVFDVDEWNVQHTPFPSSSSLWNTERNENPYFKNQNSSDPNFFLEKNAGMTIKNGHRYADFDYKLITAKPRPDSASTSTGNDWYKLKIGFTGIEAAPAGTTRCYTIAVVTQSESNSHSQSATRCFS
ncbi:MAG: M23 family metallopeptidase [Nostoc sp.]|uniref:M23 family metallopeptidase n=1 Tax=Nostoc sp. TaxID=1180 RepID=UPI002FF7D8BB